MTHPRVAIDLAAVSNRMLELEDQSEDPREDVPVGEVAAKVLGVEHTAAFDEALVRESLRVVELMDGHYMRVGVTPSPVSIAALAFVQGITFAAAVEAVRRPV